MSYLITNLPAQHVYVRKEYLRDLEDGHGKFVKGIWVCAKSIPTTCTVSSIDLGSATVIHIPGLHDERA